MSRVGVVAIGRNEGDRLRVCLESLLPQADRIVYVDSGSEDGSVDLAEGLGVDVVRLDISQPFTAARARNAGFERLRELDSGIEYVQFVDGDCEVGERWIATARGELDRHDECAAVWGRLEERFPNASIYNKLASMEWNWDLPFGDVRTFGGIVMIRSSVVKETGGYNPGIIAGEERDLAARVLELGHTIRRIDALMVKHDVAMTRFGQWWRRSVRGGHAYAEGYWNRRNERERYWHKELRSITIWGIAVPVLMIVFLPLHPIVSGILFLAYPLQVARVYRYMRGRGYGSRDSAIYAFFLILAKFPNGLGVLKYMLNRMLGRGSAIVEYK